jgi:hypothetical protein
MAKTKQNLKNEQTDLSFPAALAGIGLLTLVTLITVISVQPLPPVVVKVVLFFIFVFLGGGLLIAAVFNRWLTKQLPAEGDKQP